MLRNFAFSSKTLAVVGVVVCGVVAVVLLWANRSASDTQQKVQAQLQEASQQNQDRLAETSEIQNTSTVTGMNNSNQQDATSSTNKNNSSDSMNTPQQDDAANSEDPDWKSYEKPDRQELKDKLDPTVFKVTQNDGTESAFENELWDEDRQGIYVDVLSGEPLFSSQHKYKSGTGWPSFTKPLAPANIKTEPDYLLGYRRTEVRSKYGDNHLGHVFDDGPETVEESGGAAPTGLRYCLNSAALEFIPRSEMAERGYGQYLSIFNE